MATISAKTAVTLTVLSCLEWAIQPVHGHFLLTYPESRGWNLATTKEFPGGPQWECPCGSLPPTTNTTFWPTTGGTIALEPGWFRGHGSSTVWINLIVNSSQIIPLSKIHITSPKGADNQDPFPGTVCLPYVPIPSHLVRSEGEKGIIQVIQSHEDSGRGGAYNCADVVFTADKGNLPVPEVKAGNCFGPGVTEILLGGKGQGAGQVAGDGLVLVENSPGGGTEEGGFCLKEGKPPGEDRGGRVSSSASGGDSSSTSASPTSVETTSSAPTSAGISPVPAQSSGPARSAGLSRFSGGFSGQASLWDAVLVVVFPVLGIY